MCENDRVDDWDLKTQCECLQSILASKTCYQNEEESLGNINLSST
jgi:hypothetical protein